MQSSGYFADIYRFGVIICGPKNWFFDIKSEHDFCRYRNSIPVLSIFGSVHATCRIVCGGLNVCVFHYVLPSADTRSSIIETSSGSKEIMNAQFSRNGPIAS